MKTINRAMGIIALLTIGLVSVSANAEQKIAVVDIQRVVQSLPQIADIQKSIDDEFGERRQEIQKLQEDGNFLVQKLQRESATMSEQEKTNLQNQIQQLGQELQPKAQALQQEVQQRTNQERDKLLGYVLQAINSIATSRNIDMVLNATAVPYTKPENDISQDVLDQVSKIEYK